METTVVKPDFASVARLAMPTRVGLRSGAVFSIQTIRVFSR